MNYSSLTEDVMKAGGWYQGRNIFNKLIIPNQKLLFPKATELISEFGLLQIEFRGREPSEPIERITFDVDESRQSQIYRANYYNYKNPEEIDPKEEPDFLITEDYELTKLVSKQLGMKCCYLGFHEEYLGFDIFVAESGEIYLTHYQKPIHAADSFAEYLNKCIQAKSKSIKSPKWYQNLFK
jgi:hypothetical protein